MIFDSKTKKEGLTFMDDLIKEFYDDGADKGKTEANLKNLKSLMATCKCSVDKAMDLLETPSEERQYYKQLLNQH